MSRAVRRVAVAGLAVVVSGALGAGVLPSPAVAASGAGSEPPVAEVVPPQPEEVVSVAAPVLQGAAQSLALPSYEPRPVVLPAPGTYTIVLRPGEPGSAPGAAVGALDRRRGRR